MSTSNMNNLLTRAKQIGYLPSACLTEVTVRELLETIEKEYPDQVAAMDNRELLRRIRGAESAVRKTLMACVVAAVSTQFKGKEVHHAV